MSKINYVVTDDTVEIQKLIRNKVVSAVKCGSSDLIIARYGVNKATLIKISREEMASRSDA
jgi:hypothetical protein